jgi:hypothetical protein
MADDKGQADGKNALTRDVMQSACDTNYETDIAFEIHFGSESDITEERHACASG